MLKIEGVDIHNNVCSYNLTKRQQDILLQLNSGSILTQKRRRHYSKSEDFFFLDMKRIASAPVLRLINNHVLMYCSVGGDNKILGMPSWVIRAMGFDKT